MGWFSNAPGQFRPGAFSFLALSLLAVASLLAGCLPREPRADIVFINGAEPESLDPALVTGQADLRVVSGLFEGLTRNNPRTAAPEPALAERWEISPDGRTYTFHLRPNLAWSTGEPIVADDVLYSWFRVLEPATAADYAGQLFHVRNGEAYYTGKIRDRSQVGLRAPDTRTFQVELEGPTAFFLDLCAFPTLAVVPRRVIEQHGDRWLLARPLPVSGAYELEAWRINDKIRLRQNPRYWDVANMRNRVIDFLPVGAASVALNLYETGAGDVVWDKDLIPVELLERLRTRPDFHSFDYLGTYFIRFNVTRPAFRDARVRRAFALAIDKGRIMEKIVKGGGTLASHLTPRGVKGYEPPAGLGFDPAGARRLLAEAGYPGGAGFPAVEYMFNSGSGSANNMHERIAVEMQAMLREELGVSIGLRRVESKVYYAVQSALQYDFCRSSWVGDYNDPNTFLDLFLSNNGNNRTGWKDARYDTLLREGNAQVDPAQRAALLRQAEERLVREELPIMPLYFYVGVNYFDPRKIGGIYDNLLDLHPLHVIVRRAPAGPGAVR